VGWQLSQVQSSWLHSTRRSKCTEGVALRSRDDTEAKCTCARRSRPIHYKINDDVCGFHPVLYATLYEISQMRRCEFQRGECDHSRARACILRLRVLLRTNPREMCATIAVYFARDCSCSLVHKGGHAALSTSSIQWNLSCRLVHS